MKKILITFLLIIYAITIQSQEVYKHSLNGIKKVKIDANTSVKVIASNTAELIITGKKKTYKEKKKDEKRKGLRAIYPSGKDDTNGLGFSINKEGVILLVTDLKHHFQRKNVTFTLPKNIDVIVDGGQLGSVNIEGFSSEIEVEANIGEITINKVTGPVTAYSQVGDIDVDFITVNQNLPISINSSVGAIDVALPANTNADLDIKANTGTVYTNFNLKTPKEKGMKNISRPKKITGSINNGGVKIKLKSSVGNIYLRKK